MFKKLGLGCLGMIGALVVLGIIGAALGGGGSNNQATLVATAVPAAESAAEPLAAAAAEATAAPSGPQTYAIGDVIQVGDLAFSVLGWDVPQGNQFAQPEAGMQFVAVDLLVVNQGDRSANLSTLAQMSLKDNADRRYTIDLLAASAINGAAPEGELTPGERLRGGIGFQVPGDAGELTFVFDGGLFTSGRTFVAMGASPMRVEPPTALGGTAAPESYGVGEAISAGDLTITVNGVETPEGAQFAQPNAGNRFVVVDLSITNTGNQAANVSTLLQMKLKDATGRQYNLDLMATTAASGAAPEGELAPGETLRGPVGFQVPGDAEGLAFVFNGNVFSGGKVFVQLP